MLINLVLGVFFPVNDLKDVFIAIANQRDVFMGTSFLCSSYLNASPGFYVTAKPYLCSQ